jgi:hypothetical protein
VRDLLESWFSQLCAEGQPHAKARIRSGDNRQFQAAFWELYCHESLRRLGNHVACEPDLPGTSRHPDFLATGPSESQFVLEATVASDSDPDVAADRRKAEVFDVIDRLQASDFFLGVRVHAIGPKAPPAARLRTQLENWLNSLDADEVTAAIEADGLTFGDSVPRYVWEDAGWQVVFRPLPVAPAQRGQAGRRPIGMHGPGGAFVLDDTTPLHRAIRDKAGAYGQLGMPYVVAVASEGTFVSDFPILNALFGHEQVILTPNADGTPNFTSTRAPDGVWLGPRGVQNRRISAVLTAQLLRPWCVTTVVPTLWHHPAAEHPLVVEFLPWRKAVVDASGGLVFREPALGLNAFFDLPTDWPGPEAPFRRSLATRDSDAPRSPEKADGSPGVGTG